MRGEIKMSDTEIVGRNKTNEDISFCTEIRCSECGSLNVICDDTRGEIICNDCGLVIEEHMVDTGPEWRSYTAEERKKRDRVGSPMTYSIHDKGLSTIIGPENRDIYGNNLAPRRRAEIYRLRKWQRRTKTQSSRDRNLIQALSELDRLASQMGIPRSIKEEAASAGAYAYLGKDYDKLQIRTIQDLLDGRGFDTPSKVPTLGWKSQIVMPI